MYVYILVCLYVTKPERVFESQIYLTKKKDPKKYEMMMTIVVNNINGDCNHHKIFKMFHTNLAQEKKNVLFLKPQSKKKMRGKDIFI